MTARMKIAKVRISRNGSRNVRERCNGGGLEAFIEDFIWEFWTRRILIWTWRVLMRLVEGGSRGQSRSRKACFWVLENAIRDCGMND